MLGIACYFQEYRSIIITHCKWNVTLTYSPWSSDEVRIFPVCIHNTWWKFLMQNKDRVFSVISRCYFIHALRWRVSTRSLSVDLMRNANFFDKFIYVTGISKQEIDSHIFHYKIFTYYLYFTAKNSCNLNVADLFYLIVIKHHIGFIQYTCTCIDVLGKIVELKIIK